MNPSLIKQCLNCMICGIPYQTLPMPGVFVPGSKILFIGQNPAVMKYKEEKDEYRVLMSESRHSDEAIVEWYTSWFKRSTACKIIGELFLFDGWIESGMFSYTNAVRCRTPLNMPPSKTMQVSCGLYYTHELVKGYEGIIAMGSIAKRQVSRKLTTNVLYHIVGKKQYMLQVPHYAARESNTRFVKSSAAIRKMIDRIYPNV